MLNLLCVRMIDLGNFIRCCSRSEKSIAIFVFKRLQLRTFHEDVHVDVVNYFSLISQVIVIISLFSNLKVFDLSVQIFMKTYSSTPKKCTQVNPNLLNLVTYKLTSSEMVPCQTPVMRKRISIAGEEKDVIYIYIYFEFLLLDTIRNYLVIFL